MATATQIRYDLNIDILPSGLTSGVVSAPFDEAKAVLGSNGYEVISLPVNAELRIRQGEKANISQNGNYVREGVIYIPKKGNRLVRDSPILGSAKKFQRKLKKFRIS